MGFSNDWAGNDRHKQLCISRTYPDLDTAQVCPTYDPSGSLFNEAHHSLSYACRLGSMARRAVAQKSVEARSAPSV